MEILDYFFWFVAIFAAIYGALLLVIPKKTYVPIIEKQLIKKGNSNPTDEDIDKKMRIFRICGVICLVASGLLFYILLTGGVFGY